MRPSHTHDYGLALLKALILVIVATVLLSALWVGLEYHIPEMFVRPLVASAAWAFGTAIVLTLMPRLWWWVRIPLPLLVGVAAVALYTFRPGSPYVGASDLMFFFENLLS